MAAFGMRRKHFLRPIWVACGTSASGQVHPPRFVVDLAGRYVAPEAVELRILAATVSPKALPIFARDLAMSARHHRYNPRWAALNEASLLLARHRIDRMLVEGIAVPEAERGGVR